MATMEFDATQAPADLIADLSLSAGTTYTIQHVGTTGTLYVKRAVAAPSPGDRAFKVEAGGFIGVNADTGEGIFVWTDDAAGVPLVVDEVP